MSEGLKQTVTAGLIEHIEEHFKGIRENVADLSEAQFWQKPVDPGNSIGHLVLHMTGSLSHFVGAHLGKTGYVRDRNREFTESAPPTMEAALAGLEGAIALFARVVGGLDEAQLVATHPHAEFGSVFKTLVRMVAHVALHRGQIIYLVRLVKK